MIVEAGEDETMIAKAIVEAAAAMGVSILTLKIKVGLVTHLSCNCGGTDINSSYCQ